MTAFDAVLFDCDGVLVDSESIPNRVLCTMLNESGWSISQEPCTRDCSGQTERSQAAAITPHSRKPPNVMFTGARVTLIEKRRRPLSRVRYT